MSSTTQPRKGSTTDSDANDDKQLLEGLGIVDVAAGGEVEHQNEDVNLTCSNVVCTRYRTYELIKWIVSV